MALARIDSTVGLQPGGGYTQVRLGLDSTMEAQQWAQAGQTATSMFDQVKADDDADAIREAQYRAPALIKKDGKGMVIPPASFEAPGGYFQSGAYKRAYEHTAFATYTNSVESSHANALADIQSRNQTDIVKAQQEIDERTAATVSGLDPKYAPLITLRLNAMNGQTATRINANVVNEQTKVAEENAKIDVENAVLAVGDLARIPDRIDREEIARGPNGAEVVRLIDKANASMDAAQWSPARKEKIWQDVKVGAVIARAQRQLRDDYKALANNENMDEAAVHRWQLTTLSNMEDVAQAMGAHGPQFKEAMRQTMAEQSAKFGLKLAIRGGETQKDNQREAIAMRQRLDGAGERDSPAAQILLQEFERRRNQVYGRNDLSPAETIAKLAMYDGVIKQGRSDLSEYAYGQVQQLHAEATAIGTPPQRSRELKAEIQRIVDDPVAMSQMNPAVRSAGQRAVSALVLNEAKSDMSVGITDGNNGNLDPATSASLHKQWVDKNYVGEGPGQLMSHLEAAQWKTRSDALWQQKQLTFADAQRAVDDWNRGVLPDAIHGAALSKSLKSFREMNGETLDFEKPEHIANLSAYVNMNGGQIPPEAIAQFKSVQIGNQQKALAAAGAYQELDKLYEAHGFSADHRASILGQQLGGVGNFLKNVYTYDFDYALKQATGSGQSISVGRQGGQSKDSLVPELEAGKTAALSDINRNGGLSLAQKAGLFGGGTNVQRSTAALNPKPPSAIDYALHGLNVFSRDPAVSSYKTLAMEPEFEARVMKSAQHIMTEQGQQIKTAHPAADPNKIAFMMALQAHKDEYEVVDGGNGKGVMTFKSANTILGSALGVTVSDEGNNGWSRGHWTAYQQARVQAGLSETQVAPFDPDTVRTQRFTNSEGKSEWVMAAQAKDGFGAVELMRFRDGDPRISAYNAEILKATDKDLYKHWYGKTTTPDEKSRMYMAGVVSGKTFTWANEPLMRASQMAGDALRGAFAGAIRSSNIESRLGEAAYTPYPAAPGMGHYTKQLVDAIFESNTLYHSDPLIRLNPLRLLGGMAPDANMDLSKISESIKKSGGADFEVRARTIEMLSRLRPGQQTWNPRNPAPTAISAPSPLGQGVAP